MRWVLDSSSFFYITTKIFWCLFCCGEHVIIILFLLWFVGASCSLGKTCYELRFILKGDRDHFKRVNARFSDSLLSDKRPINGNNVPLKRISTHFRGRLQRQTPHCVHLLSVTWRGCFFLYMTKNEECSSTLDAPVAGSLRRLLSSWEQIYTCHQHQWT